MLFKRLVAALSAADTRGSESHCYFSPGFIRITATSINGRKNGVSSFHRSTDAASNLLDRA